MSSPASPTPDPFSAVLKALGQKIATDVKGGGFSLLRGFFNNVEANPTPQNVLAQGALLQASALLSGPNLEQAVISDIAKSGNALLDQLEAAPTPATPAQ